MNCDTCDGWGWLFLEDFRESTMDEILGDETDLYWLNRRNEEPLEYGLCPDCDGTGIEEDADYAENLTIIKKIDKYINYRGFDWAYLVDFDERKARRVIYFQWRTHRWNLLKLPATVPGLFED